MILGQASVIAEPGERSFDDPTHGQDTAKVIETTPVQRILDHVGEPATTTPIATTRGTPPWKEDESGTNFLDEERFTGDPLAQVEPAYDSIAVGHGKRSAGR